ncbi:MAG: PorT family protein [Bacteroidales bacterium]|nr:PorT family protein [Bacteroidales bacterium]
MNKILVTLAVAVAFGTAAVRAQALNDSLSVGDTIQIAQFDTLNLLKNYRFAAGLRFGFNGGNVRLTDECYDMYEHSLAPGAIAGAYFQWRTAFGLSLVPEIRYVGRGGNLAWEDVSYRQRVHCLDIRLGLRYNFYFKGSQWSPYIVVAPVWDIALGGKADYSDDHSGDIGIKLSKRNMRTHDFGLLCGAGVEYPLVIKGTVLNLSAEAGYNWGFVNSFTQAELDADGNVLNRYFDTHAAAGKRLARGIEISIGIGIPFGGKLTKKDNKTKDNSICTEEDKTE